MVLKFQREQEEKDSKHRRKKICAIFDGDECTMKKRQAGKADGECKGGSGGCMQGNLKQDDQ